MSRVEKHPTDEGKFQSTFDDYGHGEGNGKSRNAIYKRYKKITQNPAEPEIIESKKSEDIEITDSHVDDTTPNWGKIEWADDSVLEDETNYTKSIPKPLSAMADSKIGKMALAAQNQAIRMGFRGLDRLVTHWGRGVTGSKSWEIKRRESDYDTMTESTEMMLAHYGIQIPVNPLMMWSITMGSAYAPPVAHVLKNRDPLRPKRKGFFSRFRRKKNIVPQPITQNQEEIVDVEP